MGPVPLVGAASIVAVSVVWYYAYASRRVDREGALASALRGRIQDRAVSETARVVAGKADYEVLVAVDPETSPELEEALLAAAADLARPRDGRVVAALFEEVPDQLPLDYAAETQSPADVWFERVTEGLALRLDVPVVVGEVVSHDSSHALVNYARHRDVDVLVLAHPDLGSSVARPSWVDRRAPCDVVYVADPAYGRPLDGVTVLASRGPADPAAVGVADAVAHAHGVALTVSYPDAGDERTRASLAAYHRDLTRVCAASVRAGFVRTDGSGGDDPAHEGTVADELVVAATDWSDHPRSSAGAGTALPGLVVHSHSTGRRRLPWRLLERVVY